MRRLVWYLGLSFLILFAAAYMSRYHTSLPESLRNNNILYNISSVLRTILVGGYLIYHRHLVKFRFLKYLFYAYIVLAIMTFIFDSPFSHVSVILTSGTSIVLLIICLTYFLNAIMDDEETITAKEPAFIICMGLSIYESINFFIYLFLYQLTMKNLQFFLFTAKIFMYSVVIYNIFIAFAFYHSRKKRPPLAV